MTSSSRDPQDKLNQLNGDIRKALVLIDNLILSKKRDIERVEHRYNNDIERHQQAIKRLTREIEELEGQIARNK